MCRIGHRSASAPTPPTPAFPNEQTHRRAPAKRPLDSAALRRKQCSPSFSQRRGSLPPSRELDTRAGPLSSRRGRRSRGWESRFSADAAFAGGLSRDALLGVLAEIRGPARRRRSGVHRVCRDFLDGASRTRTGDLLGAIRARTELESCRFAGISSAAHPIQGSPNAQGLAAITESLPPRTALRGQT